MTTTVRLQSGEEQKKVTYPVHLTVFSRSYDVNAVLGPDAAKNTIKADIEGFARLMSDPNGFARPVGAYNSAVAQLKTDTDGNLANGEILNIQLFGNGASGAMEIQKILATGQTVGIIYTLTNDTAGEKKIRDLIVFFGVEPLLTY